MPHEGTVRPVDVGRDAMGARLPPDEARGGNVVCVEAPGSPGPLRAEGQMDRGVSSASSGASTCWPRAPPQGPRTSRLHGWPTVPGRACECALHPEGAAPRRHALGTETGGSGGRSEGVSREASGAVDRLRRIVMATAFSSSDPAGVFGLFAFLCPRIR